MHPPCAVCQIVCCVTVGVEGDLLGEGVCEGCTPFAEIASALGSGEKAYCGIPKFLH